ncbi:hypothetical protein E2562_032593 [Oryza meyeriana var. granulata]|uniref:Uncharacterized protein n=1 Tax=Oryza meyeriana var. granulata TaxID=110450 RepID=A0A6G1EC82_9ORYZ|nr:hypothetical protein E2562_032593 [Oryza meyeriana var. granulata]
MAFSCRLELYELCNWEHVPLLSSSRSGDDNVSAECSGSDGGVAAKCSCGDRGVAAECSYGDGGIVQLRQQSMQAIAQRLGPPGSAPWLH